MSSRPVTLMGLCVVLSGLAAASPLTERLEAAHKRFLEERREALGALKDPFGVPEAAKEVVEMPREAFRGRFPWKRNVVAAVFWVGMREKADDPAPGGMGAWDRNRRENFGGDDDPEDRNGFFLSAFVPGLNPFYVALPYNDLGEDGRHRPEAARVIPWFWEKYRGEGISVCKGRWLAIHYQGQVCFAQWEEVGPSGEERREYVFGNEGWRPGAGGEAGMAFSPAVRDFLKFRPGDRVEWRFVEDHEVPDGPWRHLPGEPPLPDW